MELRRFFVSVTIIAAGLTMISPLIRKPPQIELLGQLVIVFVCWFGGTGLIGFGLLHPFKRGWLGSIIAFVLQCAFGNYLLNGF
jgi:hypothetical protein